MYQPDHISYTIFFQALPFARMRSEGSCSWMRVCVLGCIYGAPVRPENAANLAGNEGQKIGGDLPKTTVFKSYVAEHARKSQLLMGYSIK